MKKLLLACLCLLLTLPAFAETFQYTYEGQTLNYETIENGECRVSTNHDISGAVSIPEKAVYKGSSLKVTQIGDEAFSGCKQITSIKFPMSLKSIGKSAFKACENLTRVSIPNNVSSIGAYAFHRCFALTEVYLGSRLQRLDGSAFLACSNLKNIVVFAFSPPNIVVRSIFIFNPKNCNLCCARCVLPVYLISPWWNGFGSYQTMLFSPNEFPLSITTVTAGYDGIVVDNAPFGSTVVVKDINNETVTTEVIRDATQTIPVNRKGMFIVNVDDATYKVAL